MGNKGKFMRASAFGQGAKKLKKVGRAKDVRSGVKLLMGVFDAEIETRKAAALAERRAIVEVGR